MDTKAVEDTGAGGAPGVGQAGAAQVFGNDVVMTLAVLKEAQYLVLRRFFGVSRGQANLLAAVLVLGSADAAYVTVRHVLHQPMAVTGADVAMGGSVLREVAYGVAGPGARGVPFFGALVAGGLVAGLAVPSVRRAMHGVRRAEHRIREHRLRVFNARRRVES